MSCTPRHSNEFPAIPLLEMISSHASIIAQSTRLLMDSSSFSHRWADGGGFDDWAGRDGIRLIRRCESDCCVCDVIARIDGRIDGGGRTGRPFDTRVKVCRVMGRGRVSTVGNSHPCRSLALVAGPVWDQTSE